MTMNSTSQADFLIFITIPILLDNLHLDSLELLRLIAPYQDERRIHESNCEILENIIDQSFALGVSRHT